MNKLRESITIYLYFCLSVSGECPRRDDLHCQMYDTTSCPAGTKVGATYINYNGKNCEGCRMCLPESGETKIEVNSLVLHS